MHILIASFYVVPALLLSLGLWMFMRLLHEFRFPVWARRLLFIVLVTVLLAPTVSGDGIIIVVLVPYGLLALSGAPPMLHQPQLVNFAVGSFLLTAITASLIACPFVNDERPRPTPASKIARAARIVLPLGIIAALLTLYYDRIPNWKIPAHIDRALVESAYGAQMDALFTTLELEAIEDVLEERQRLRDLFEKDEVFLGVYFSDQRLESHPDKRSVFHRKIDSSSWGCSSTGDGKYRNEGLIRCIRRVGPFRDKEILKYQRTFSNGEETPNLNVIFDYDVFLKNHPAP